VFQREEDALDRRFHPGHLKGGRVEFGLGAQEGAGFGIGPVTAIEKQLL
jgi:hypothetical protein